MSKKGSGFFTFVTGLAAGAVAIFLAKKSNRDLAAKEVKAAARAAQKIRVEIKKNPQAFEKKMVKQGKKMANQALKVAKKSVSAKGRSTSSGKKAINKITKRSK